MNVVIRHVLLFSLILPHAVLAQKEEPSPLFELSGSLPDVIPDVVRRELSMPRIDTEYFELGAMAGTSIVEGFGSNFSTGFRAAIHASRIVFIEASMLRSTVSDNVYRRLGLPLFGDKGSVDINSLLVLAGLNIFPGEVYLGEFMTLSTDIYVVGGAGTVAFGRKEYFTGYFGMGVRLMPYDWMSVRFEALASEYESDIFGFEKISHNADLSLGINVFF